jgi:cobalt/nickel transport system ATP-binding protein
VKPLFELEQVGFSYPGRPAALRGVTLRVLQGENLALLGANGSGKSTLLQILAGLQFATEGSVAFDGISIGHDTLSHDAGFRSRFRSTVGILFQNSDTQLFCPTVREEVAFGPLQVKPEPEALEITDRMLAAFGLARLADEAPYALSGGEKKKVALAAVLAMEPQVLLLDEPTANLDPKTCDFLFDTLGGFVSDANRTVITATHDLGVARLLGRTCALLTPEHTVAMHAPIEQILGDPDLLLQVNLVGRMEARADGGASLSHRKA